MKTVGLFAGIGGLELGFEKTHAFRTVLMAEIDPQCQQVLRQRFDAQIVGDVVDIASLPEADVLLAGFPCQPYSQVGTTRGWECGRDHVNEMFRLLDGRRAPQHVVLENVPFIVHLQHGKTLRRILTGFEERRYLWAYRIIDASAFGVPQRRRRFILVASRTLDPAAMLLAEDADLDEPVHARVSTNGFYWTEGNRGIGWAVNAVPPLKVGSSWGIASPPAFWVRKSGGIYTPRIRGAELLQGFDAGWTEVEATKAGRPARDRWRMVGNAVSVPVAEWVARRLLLKPETVVDGAEMKSSDCLPRAAFYNGDARYRSSVGAFPVIEPLEPLGAFLKRQYQPLSHGATRGFRERYESSNLKKNLAFIEALREHERSVWKRRRSFEPLAAPEN